MENQPNEKLNKDPEVFHLPESKLDVIEIEGRPHIRKEIVWTSPDGRTMTTEEYVPMLHPSEIPLEQQDESDPAA